ncbi:VOC family protein [Pseudolabrys taiwanensis]|uniref:VOC family protein n=1 Tax=Pseudolabrys taiwanensis TaxID=331696 RepID=A0A346A223_9HYPH|nr:VOC family protein [Pseudolabrys taiwanensis]AXK83220.1 VOC family protein [Pseudolabrys taiwanensis]
MARLRHFAISVKDVEKSAEFYEKTFGLKRVGRDDIEELGSGIYLTDGVINLALLQLKDPNARMGVHHFGFQIDDADATAKKIEENGGKFFFNLGDAKEGNFESKYKDPEGVVFDISEHGWLGTDSYKASA